MSSEARNGDMFLSPQNVAPYVAVNIVARFRAARGSISICRPFCLVCRPRYKRRVVPKVGGGRGSESCSRCDVLTKLYAKDSEGVI